MKRVTLLIASLLAAACSLPTGPSKDAAKAAQAKAALEAASQSGPSAKLATN